MAPSLMARPSSLLYMLLCLLGLCGVYGSRAEGGLRGRMLQTVGPTASAAYNQRVEVSALQALKASFKDPLNLLRSWVGSNPCMYAFVNCETVQSVFFAIKTPMGMPMSRLVVTGLDLNALGLGGTISPKIALLKYLGYVHMSHNSLVGTVPDLKPLLFLNELDLGANSLQGGFPMSILTLSRLKYLDIRFNRFTGQLPAQLFQMKLDVLAINNNRFIANQGQWSLFPRTTASVAVLGNNPLQGSLPLDVSALAASLEELVVCNASIQGRIPTSIGNLSAARVIDLSNNGLTGGLPSPVGLQNLQDLNVASNQLTQSILSLRPVLLLPRIQNVTITSNFFSGVLGPVTATSSKLNAASNCISGLPNQRSTSQCKTFLRAAGVQSSA